MYFISSNFNRLKVTKIIFGIFLVIGILNWSLRPEILIYAEGETAPEENAAVKTNDALSQSGIQNDTDTTNTANTENIQTQDAEQNQENTENTTSDLNAQSQNNSETENNASTIAETGINAASSTDNVVIETGDAVANADVINVTNTNVVDSSGSVVAGGAILDGLSLDLRDDFGELKNTCDSCLKNVLIENQNTATATNNVTVEANTGGNIASSTASSTISTGDAYAGANVVNILNTNIVKSNYMLLVFNNFGDWSGDLIFPNGDFFGDFFSNLAGTCNNCNSNTEILNKSQANVLNTANTSAESGDNRASGDEASINTGDSGASSNVYNKINTNVYGGSSFYLLVKVFGDWNGNIFNLPADIVWQKTADGLVLYNEKDGNPFEDEKQLGKSDNISIENTNNAEVSNSIKVNANTGKNSASGENSFIKTGNAYAGANVVNIVNTNIMSANWTAALINVFGNWQGNVSFGQPDLWVGTVAESVGTLSPNSLVKFVTTIKNEGDATASGIKVSARPQSKFLNLNESEWFLSPLKPGESVRISYYGTITGDLPAGHTNIKNQIRVSLYETDGNMKNNTDVINLLAYAEGGIFLPYSSRSSSYPNLEVTKTHSLPSTVITDGIEFVPFGGSVDYRIVVKNKGGSAFEGILFDQLKNENGELVMEQSWDLGEILPDEEIIITYTTELTDKIVAGTYTNYAWVEALGGDFYESFLTFNADSNVASDKIIVAEKPKILDRELTKMIGGVLGIYNQNVSVVEQKENSAEFLEGFCRQGNQNVPKFSFSQSILLGLSFILIMQKSKNFKGKLILF